jgi:hypothetical protein
MLGGLNNGKQKSQFDDAGFDPLLRISSWPQNPVDIVAAGATRDKISEPGYTFGPQGIRKIGHWKHKRRNY